MDTSRGATKIALEQRIPMIEKERKIPNFYGKTSVLRPPFIAQHCETRHKKPTS